MENPEFHSSMLEKALDIILSVAPDGRILYFNQGAENAYHYSAKEFCDRYQEPDPMFQQILACSSWLAKTAHAFILHFDTTRNLFHPNTWHRSTSAGYRPGIPLPK